MALRRRELIGRRLRPVVWAGHLLGPWGRLLQGVVWAGHLLGPWGCLLQRVAWGGRRLLVFPNWRGVWVQERLLPPGFPRHRGVWVQMDFVARCEFLGLGRRWLVWLQLAL